MEQSDAPSAQLREQKNKTLASVQSAAQSVSTELEKIFKHDLKGITENQNVQLTHLHLIDSDVNAELANGISSLNRRIKAFREAAISCGSKKEDMELPHHEQHDHSRVTGDPLNNNNNVLHGHGAFDSIARPALSLTTTTAASCQEEDCDKESLTVSFRSGTLSFGSWSRSCTASCTVGGPRSTTMPSEDRSRTVEAVGDVRFDCFEYGSEIASETMESPKLEEFDLDGTLSDEDMPDAPGQISFDKRARSVQSEDSADGAIVQAIKTEPVNSDNDWHDVSFTDEAVVKDEQKEDNVATPLANATASNVEDHGEPPRATYSEQTVHEAVGKLSQELVYQTEDESDNDKLDLNQEKEKTRSALEFSNIIWPDKDGDQAQLTVKQRKLLTALRSRGGLLQAMKLAESLPNLRYSTVSSDYPSYSTYSGGQRTLFLGKERHKNEKQFHAEEYYFYRRQKVEYSKYLAEKMREAGKTRATKSIIEEALKIFPIIPRGEKYSRKLGDRIWYITGGHEGLDVFLPLEVDAGLQNKPSADISELRVDEAKSLGDLLKGKDWAKALCFLGTLVRQCQEGEIGDELSEMLNSAEGVPEVLMGFLVSMGRCCNCKV